MEGEEKSTVRIRDIELNNALFPLGVGAIK